MNLQNACACLLLLVALGLPRPVDAQELPDETEFVIADFRLETQPGGYLYPNFFENLAPDAVWLSEESNGFGLLDQPRVYFEGDSWTQFDWHYAGHAINSALDDGAPALQIPILAIGSMALQSETPRRRGYGFHVSPRTPQRTLTRLMLSTVFPDLGGYLGLGKLAVANHASMRAEDLYYTRRKIAGSYQLDFSFEKKSPLSSLLLAIGYFSLNRRFNDFNRRDQPVRGGRRPAAAPGALAEAIGQGDAGAWTWSSTPAAATACSPRTAATRRRPTRQDKTLLAGRGLLGGPPVQSEISWLQEWQERRPAVSDAGKDLRDIDGQGFFPFEKWGRFRRRHPGPGRGQTFAVTWLGKTADRALPGPEHGRSIPRAEQTGTSNAIFFAGQPYLVYSVAGGRRLPQPAALRRGRDPGCAWN